MLLPIPLYLGREEGEKFKEVLTEELTESIFYEQQFIMVTQFISQKMAVKTDFIFYLLWYQIDKHPNSP